MTRESLILETERLRLRHLRLEDLDDLYALYCDPAVTRFIPDAPRTIAEARAEIEWFQNGHPRHPQLGLWATTLKPTGRFIGRCGLLPWTIAGQLEVEVAYALAPAHWGRGLATEAARGLAQYAFERLGLTRLICLIDPVNLASARVARKLGMTCEKEFVDEYGPALVYAMSKPGMSGAP